MNYLFVNFSKGRWLRYFVIKNSCLKIRRTSWNQNQKLRKEEWNAHSIALLITRVKDYIYNGRVHDKLHYCNWNDYLSFVIYNLALPTQSTCDLLYTRSWWKQEFKKEDVQMMGLYIIIFYYNLIINYLLYFWFDILLDSN